MYYEQVFKALNRDKVKYLIIGGMAVNLYGLPRFTNDLDIFAELSEENLLKLVKALKKLGFKPRVPVRPEDLADKKKREEWKRKRNMVVFSLYNEKIPYEVVDVLLNTTLDFTKAYKRRREIGAAGIKIPLVSIGDLLTLKKTSSRKQDLADLKALTRIKEI